VAVFAAVPEDEFQIVIAGGKLAEFEAVGLEGEVPGLAPVEPGGDQRSPVKRQHEPGGSARPVEGDAVGQVAAVEGQALPGEVSEMAGAGGSPEAGGCAAQIDIELAEQIHPLQLVAGSKVGFHLEGMVARVKRWQGQGAEVGIDPPSIGLSGDFLAIEPESGTLGTFHGEAGCGDGFVALEGEEQADAGDGWLLAEGVWLNFSLEAAFIAGAGLEAEAGAEGFVDV